MGVGYNPYRKENGEFATKSEAGAKCESDLNDAIESGNVELQAEIEEVIMNDFAGTEKGQELLEKNYGNTAMTGKSKEHVGVEDFYGDDYDDDQPYDDEISESHERTYTMLDDAKQVEIIDAIEASGVVTADEFDVDSIADEVFVYDKEKQGFRIKDGMYPSQFWDIVESHNIEEKEKREKFLSQKGEVLKNFSQEISEISDHQRLLTAQAWNDTQKDKAKSKKRQKASDIAWYSGVSAGRTKEMNHLLRKSAPDARKKSWDESGDKNRAKTYQARRGAIQDASLALINRDLISDDVFNTLWEPMEKAGIKPPKQ